MFRIQSLFKIFRYPGKMAEPDLADLFWIIKLRWLAIAVFFFLTFPALHFGYLNGYTALYYLGSVAILFVFNLLSSWAWSENKATQKREVSPVVICFHLAFDLLILTVLLLVSGGSATPFLSLFLLNACLGGLLIPGRLSWPFLVLIHSLLGFLQFNLRLEGKLQDLPNVNVMMIATHLLLFGFWLVMRSLGGYLEVQRTQQMNARVLLEKQDRLRAIGALAAGFSHEFASPLNAAKIRLERLRRNSPNDDVMAALSAVLACEDVVHQMNSSQMDARDFHKKKIRAADLLGDVIDSWQEDHSEVVIQREISDVGEILLPPLNFAQVILNLLDNAFDAAPGKEIRVSLKAEAQRIVFQVEDQGPGFAAGVLEKWGEPFNTGKAEGTGLGLYVSQLFAASLGGELQIRTGHNQGGASGAQVLIHWPQMREDT